MKSLGRVLATALGVIVAGWVGSALWEILGWTIVALLHIPFVGKVLASIAALVLVLWKKLKDGG